MKKVITHTSIALLFLLICIIALYNFNKMSMDRHNEYDYPSIYYKERELEGKMIWEVSEIEKDTFMEFVYTNNAPKTILFFIVDSIFCYSCFKYHADNIAKVNGDSLLKVGYTTKKTSFLKKYIENIKEFPIKEKSHVTNKLINLNLAVAVVNFNGRIIYIDIADKKFYKKSDAFYNTINRF